MTNSISIPHELVKTQTQRNTTMTTIYTNESFGRHVIAKKNIQQGTTLGYYVGKLIQGASEHDNDYILSSHTWNDYHIDGTPPEGEPSRKYTLSYINGDYGDGDLVNCKFNHEGLVYKTKRISKGDQLFLEYGNNYTWNNMVRHMLISMVKKMNSRATLVRRTERPQYQIPSYATVI